MLEVEKVMAYMKANPDDWFDSNEVKKAIGSKASTKKMACVLVYLSDIGGLSIQRKPGRPHTYRYNDDVDCVGSCGRCASKVERRVLVGGICNACRRGRSANAVSVGETGDWRTARDKSFTAILRLPFGLPMGAYERIVRGNKLCL
ncbi:hypothetical protein J7Y46_002132 [Vibrio parahaemolyticus]|nr:hypothetical protein [Vibrio parahaemolyticus]